MTDIAIINRLFETAIAEKAVYRKLGITARTVASMRYNYKKHGRVRMEKRLWVLQKLGYDINAYSYTKANLVELLKFYNRCSQAARDLGPEYVAEKFIDQLTNKNK